MAKQIIDARIKQKTGTFEEWNNNPLILLDGEVALVRTATGALIQQRVGDGFKTFAELPDNIRYDQSAFISVDSSVKVTGNYTVVGAGTYGGVTVGADKIAVLYWNGTGWVKNFEGELPKVDVDGIVAAGNTNAVSGGEVYDKFSDIIGDIQVNSTVMNYAVVTSPLSIGANGFSRVFKVQKDKYYTVSRNTIEGNRFQIYKINIDHNDTPALGDPLTPIFSDTTNSILDYTFKTDFDGWVYIYLNSSIVDNIELNVSYNGIVIEAQGKIEEDEKAPVSGAEVWREMRFLSPLKTWYISTSVMNHAVSTSPLSIGANGFSRVFKVQKDKYYTVSRNTIEGNRFNIYKVNIDSDSTPKSGDPLTPIFSDTTNSILDYTFKADFDGWVYVYLNSASIGNVELLVSTELDNSNSQDPNFKDISLKLNRGSLTNRGIYQYVHTTEFKDSEFYKNYRTDRFVNISAEFQGFFTILNFLDLELYNLRIIEFDASYSFIKSSLATSSQFKIALNTRYVKFHIYKKDDSNIDDYPIVRLRAKIYKSIYSYNTADSTSTVKTVINSGYFNGRDFDNQATANSPVQYSEQDYYTHTIARFPKNYHPDGEPTKIIWFAHGSGGADLPDFYASYIPYVRYLVDQGYIVVDVFAWNNKYPTAVQYMNTPTNIACSNAMFKFYFENYNVDKTGVYICGKSHGGYQCYSAEYVIRFPIKAVGVLAGGLNLFSFNYGYHNNDRIASMQDLEVQEDYTPILTESGGNYSVIARNYFKRNIDKFVGYVPLFQGAINLTPEDMVPDTLSGLLDIDFTAIQRVPTKTWIAKDDPAIDRNSLLCREKAVKKSGSLFEIRYMPSGTSDPHHTVDYAGPFIPEIKTKTGVIHYNVPVAWAEMLQYFQRF